jgi:hypothetical protein
MKIESHDWRSVITTLWRALLIHFIGVGNDAAIAAKL